MKGKFTTIIMLLLGILIVAVIGLFGLIAWDEIHNYLVAQTSGDLEEVELFIADKSQYADTLEKDIEVPKIRNTSSSSNNPLTELEQSNVNNAREPEVDYENVTINKYFYSQLNNYSQTIYKAFENNKENMKSGTYKVNLGSSFSSILDKVNGQEELGNYYQSAIEAYIYDNPDIFYLSPSKMYLNIETITRGNQRTYNLYIDCGEESNYLVDEFNSKYAVEVAIGEVENVRNKIISQKTGDTYSDIKMVHDYLINNIDYDTSISKSNIYNIYGALVNHECVCEGYAEALKYLLDGLGIESTLVIGKGTNSDGESENHAWNYVKIDNTWYAIDSTWDDPIVIGGGFVGNGVKYKYFLKGSNTMNRDHFPSGKFTENGMTFTYPSLSSRDY